MGGLWWIPLGAAGGLLEIVVALAVGVPLGDPAGWEGRAACGGSVRGWCSVLAVLGLVLLAVGSLVGILGVLTVARWVGAEMFGTWRVSGSVKTFRRRYAWEMSVRLAVYHHACLPPCRPSSAHLSSFRRRCP